MAVTYREVRQGESGTFIVDCGDNAAIDTSIGPQDRIVLQAGESVSSATVTVSSKPTGADDPTLGTPAVVASNKECNGRIVGSGEGFTCTYSFASDAVTGLYTVQATVTTDQSRVLPQCIYLECVTC